MVSKIADAIIEGKTETESAGDAQEAFSAEEPAYEAYAEPEETVTTLADAEAGV